MSFETLGLAPEYLRAVAEEGYTEPTPVQREAIPLVLAGRDLLAGAQTGTGKTAAFVLPMLQLLRSTSPDPATAGRTARGATNRTPIRALVLTPTRELALQVEESVRTYGRHRPVRSVAIYGGVGIGPQVRALRAGPEIVVATPGRLLDHLSQGAIDLSRVEILVLDEADRMLDLGFIRDIRRVLALVPAKRQNLLFSATFSDEIRELAAGFMHQPASVDVAPRNTAAELVDQVVIPVDRERKRELLAHLVRSRRVERALVFTRTKHGANRLAEQLERDGIGAAAIHGNKSQGQRVRALADFKAGRVNVLVATDIAARGIDIDALPHVVNYELPMVPADYIHRIGRTGRAGVGGEAVSLVCVDEASLLRDIQQHLRRAIPSETVEGFEPDRTIRAEPIRLRSGGGEAPRGRGQRSGGGPGRGPGTSSGRGPSIGSGIGQGTPSAQDRNRRPHRSAARPTASIGSRPVRGPGAWPAASPAAPGTAPAHRRPSPDRGGEHRIVALPGERLSRTSTGQAIDRPGSAPASVRNR